jgi:hypothetical protein
VVFSNRERYVGVAVAVAVAIFALDRYLLSPYLARLEAVDLEQQDATVQLDKQTAVFNDQRRLRKVWSDMRANNALVPDAWQAEAQLMQALQTWADEAGVKVGTRKPEQPVPEAGFVRTGVQFTGTGSTAAISKFLWRLETAPLPIRVSELTLRSRVENTDNLTVNLNVSTLSIVPTPETARQPAGGRAAAPADAPSFATGGRS